MRCPRCEADNPEGLKFCGECGTPLTAPCTLYRLQGELVLQHTLRQQVPGSTSIVGHSEAEVHLRRAIAVARRRHAKSLELRAAMSLSRLWQRQGKRAAAR
jgi:hypothetical protein